MLLTLVFRKSVAKFVKKTGILDELFVNDIHELHEQIKELRIWQLRRTIVADDFPMEERINAGDLYVNKYKQNGVIKAIYHRLLLDYENSLRIVEPGEK